MNLFILSLIHKQCAEWMFDKHISKMIIEAVQMLSTGKRLLDPDDVEKKGLDIYKIGHKNHPTTIWIRTSLDNYIWTLLMVEAMHNEWKYRYGHPPEKMHASYLIAITLAGNLPRKEQFPKTGLTPFALAMPQQYKPSIYTSHKDAVEAYRRYYQSPDKQRFASWKNREKPEWYVYENNNRSTPVRTQNSR